MKAKKLLAVVTALMLSVSLFTACGEKTDSSAGSGTVSVAIIDKGYGTDWLYEIIDAYETDTGKKVKVVKNTPDASWFNTTLEAGPETNKVDLYFSISASYLDAYLSLGSTVVDGYDCVLEDLSSLYNETLTDYGKSLKQLLPEYYLDAMTFGGKQYTIPWALGLEGMLYNTQLFSKYNLSVPRTTDEMLDTFDAIKTIDNGTYATVESGAAEGNTIYPITYAGENNYLMYAWQTWWAQYEGITNFNNFLKGVNSDGVYTADIFAQTGRLEALKIVNEMLYTGTSDETSNGYVNRKYRSDSFTTSQLKFLNGESFFAFNGDWMEREAQSNANADDISFMKTPVLSAIIDKLPQKSVTSDEQLCEVIDYIDGVTQTKPAYVNDEDLAYITTARNMACTEGEAHITYIPSYAANKEEAKDFLRYWLTKKAQNIQMEYSYGNVAPLSVDVTNLSYYSSLSDLQVSKFEIWNNSNFIGRKYNTPMTYNGGLTTFNVKISPESAFGCDTNSSSYKSAEQYVADELTYFRNKWANMMQNAGVNN